MGSRVTREEFFERMRVDGAGVMATFKAFDAEGRQVVYSTAKSWVARHGDPRKEPEAQEKRGELHVIRGGAGGRLALKNEALDEKAKPLIRKGAMRCLREIAGVDAEGVEREDWDAKTARDAASTLAQLVQVCPGVLGLEKQTAEAGAPEMPDLTTPAGMDALLEEMSELPAQLLREAAKRSESA